MVNANPAKGSSPADIAVMSMAVDPITMAAGVMAMDDFTEKRIEYEKAMKKMEEEKLEVETKTRQVDIELRRLAFKDKKVQEKMEDLAASSDALMKEKDKLATIREELEQEKKKAQVATASAQQLGAKLTATSQRMATEETSLKQMKAYLEEDRRRIDLEKEMLREEEHKLALAKLEVKEQVKEAAPAKVSEQEKEDLKKRFQELEGQVLAWTGTKRNYEASINRMEGEKERLRKDYTEAVEAREKTEADFKKVLTFERAHHAEALAKAVEEREAMRNKLEEVQKNIEAWGLKQISWDNEKLALNLALTSMKDQVKQAEDAATQMHGMKQTSLKREAMAMDMKRETEKVMLVLQEDLRIANERTAVAESQLAKATQESELWQSKAVEAQKSASTGSKDTQEWKARALELVKEKEAANKEILVLQTHHEELRRQLKHVTESTKETYLKVNLKQTETENAYNELVRQSRERDNTHQLELLEALQAKEAAQGDQAHLQSIVKRLQTDKGEMEGKVVMAQHEKHQAEERLVKVEADRAEAEERLQRLKREVSKRQEAYDKENKQLRAMVDLLSTDQGLIGDKEKRKVRGGYQPDNAPRPQELGSLIGSGTDIPGMRARVENLQKRESILSSLGSNAQQRYNNPMQSAKYYPSEQPNRLSAQSLIDSSIAQHVVDNGEAGLGLSITTQKSVQPDGDLQPPTNLSIQNSSQVSSSGRSNTSTKPSPNVSPLPEIHRPPPPVISVKDNKAYMEVHLFEKFGMVEITLGYFVHLKVSFDQANVAKTGWLVASELQGWCVSKGMKSMTEDKVTKMINIVDTSGQGRVFFWDWIGIQTYLYLKLQSDGISFGEWLEFATQTNVRKAPSIATI